MTHVTIHYLDTTTMALDFPFDADKKAAVAAIVGATWDKKPKRWNVPLARLGDVVKLFWPDVSIDYGVLVARDEQLKRMFRQYIAAGVRFAARDGAIWCDNDILCTYMQKVGTALHVQALTMVLAEPARVQPAMVTDTPHIETEDDRKMKIIITGTQNAKIAAAKKAAIIQRNRPRRRKVAA